MEVLIDFESYRIHKSIDANGYGTLVLLSPSSTTYIEDDYLSGREIFLFDYDGKFIWQIMPEMGASDNNYKFDKNRVQDFYFSDIFYSCRYKNYSALRENGDRFVIDMNTGEAKYGGWQRT